MEIIKLNSPDPSIRIKVRTFSGEILLKPSEIIYFISSRNYTWLHLLDGEKIIISHTLSWVYNTLSSYGFCYINKSCIVNSEHIRCILVKGEKKLVLTNKVTLPVSRRKKSVLEDLLRKRE